MNGCKLSKDWRMEMKEERKGKCFLYAPLLLNLRVLFN